MGKKNVVMENMLKCIIIPDNSSCHLDANVIV